MKAEIKVPSMGESISEASVGALLKANGSSVKMDDEVLELETDKVNQILFAPASGNLTLTVKTGDIVKIGDVVGYVDGEAKKEEEKKVEVKPTPQVSEGGARISKENYMEQLLKKPEVASKPVIEKSEERKKMSKVRQVIAKRLVESQQSTAMLTTFNEIDLSEVMEIRNKYKETFQKDYGAKLGFMSFFVKATVSALQAFPELNSYIEGDEIVTRNYFDIGIAVGTDRGLFVPVVRGCDHLNFAEIEQAIEAFGKKAREGKLAVDDLQGGGFTITNGGVYGSLLSTPILNPPQSGILGMHKIEKRPVVVDDQIVIRPMMYLALSYDHRIVDGKEAVSFLVHIKNCLEDPARMLLGV